MLSTCTAYVSTFVAEILGWTPSVLSWLSLLSSVEENAVEVLGIGGQSASGIMFISLL